MTAPENRAFCALFRKFQEMDFSRSRGKGYNAPQVSRRRASIQAAKRRAARCVFRGDGPIIFKRVNTNQPIHRRLVLNPPDVGGVSIGGKAAQTTSIINIMSSIILDSQATLDKRRFDALWSRCSTSDHAVDASHIWDNLVKRYAERHRYYHNKKHLVFCLQLLDEAAPFVEDKDALEMAIWFHDVVFEPNARDNEERSAALFKILSKDHLDPSFINTVSKIIVATKHISGPKHNNEAYMLDIDLASIGLPWGHFRRDCKDLRAESGGISDMQFYSGKKKFLDVLLRRPRIYYTDYFSTRYEDEARQNMLRYASWIEAQGYR